MLGHEDIFYLALEPSTQANEWTCPYLDKQLLFLRLIFNYGKVFELVVIKTLGLNSLNKKSLKEE